MPSYTNDFETDLNDSLNKWLDTGDFYSLLEFEDNAYRLLARLIKDGGSLAEFRATIKALLERATAPANNKREKNTGGPGKWFGIDSSAGKIADMRAKSVIEPLAVKLQVLRSAAEAAEMIVRIDDVIAASKTKAPPTPSKSSPD